MKLSKKLIFVFLLLGLLFLTGCGIEVKTNMTINNQFEGSKIISCFVSKQDMTHHFKGDSTRIDTMLENHCPGCFEYAKNETSTGTEYIFTLSFTSLEDYKAALSTVLNFSPEVQYKGVDSIFSKSIDLTENFSSIDLLRWFEILLTEEYEITNSQLEKLWDIKDTTVTWMNQNYVSNSDTIHISDHSYSAFDGISIYTEEKEDRTFTRKICFSIPKNTLDTRVLELEQLFKEMKPEGTTGIWTTTDTGKSYEITFQADSFEELSKKTGQAFNAKSQNMVAGAEILNHPYLKIDLSYSETLDFSRFLCTEQGEVPVTYYFKPNSYTKINSERLQKEINNAFIPKEYEDGYFRIFHGNCSILKITTLGTMNLPVNVCSITTTLKENNQLSREFIFTISDILHQNEEELLSSIAKSNSNETVKIDLTKDTNDLIFSILQSGTINELNQSSELLFPGVENQIIYEESGILDLISKDKFRNIQDRINLSDYITDSADLTTLNYTFKDHSSNTLEECYILTSEDKKLEISSIDNNNYSFEKVSKEFTFHYTGSSPSIVGISILLFLIFLILIGILLFILKNPMKRYLSTEDDGNE